jgi:hypothetical protein
VGIAREKRKISKPVFLSLYIEHITACIGYAVKTYRGGGVEYKGVNIKEAEG